MDETKNKPLDPENIGYVVTLLKISKHRLFENAFRGWYGRDADKNTLEAHVRQYQADNVVPFWVRLYVRNILTESHTQKRTIRKIILIALSYLVPPVLVILLIMFYFTTR